MLPFEERKYVKFKDNEFETLEVYQTFGERFNDQTYNQNKENMHKLKNWIEQLKRISKFVDKNNQV